MYHTFSSINYSCASVCTAVVGCVLVPGLRKHGILQKVTSVMADKIAALRKTQEKAKAN